MPLAHDPYDGATHPDVGTYRDEVDHGDQADYYDPTDAHGATVYVSNPDALDELQAACRPLLHDYRAKFLPEPVEITPEEQAMLDRKYALGPPA